MNQVQHLEMPALEAALDVIRSSPKDAGRVELIVRRPAVDQREVLSEAVLDRDDGLVGDSWRARGSGSPHPDRQLTLMNSRVVSLLAGTSDRWELAGDQLFVDLDLGVENLPPGTMLEIGTAVIEVTAEPHRGCKKFAARYGTDAFKFVNSDVGRELNLRGINTKVVVSGVVRPSDVIRKRLA
jgi:MOSC domain-containing protein YiiM